MSHYVFYNIQIAPSNFLVPVCVCIVSRVPFLTKFKRILSMLDNKEVLTQLKYPLEVYLNYFTSSIPRLPRTLYEFNFMVFDTDMIKLTPPPLNELPIFDIPLFPLAKLLTPDNIVKIFNIILLEYPIIFMSHEIGTLNSVISAFLSLLYPFQWNLMCIPVLPKKFIDILQFLLPYVIGVPSFLF